MTDDFITLGFVESAVEATVSAVEKDRNKIVQGLKEEIKLQVLPACHND
jgi:hypothetical protein